MQLELGCKDFERVLGWQTARCCPCCHQDMQRGAEGIEVYIPHGDCEVRIEVCCEFAPPAFYGALESETQSLLARALAMKPDTGPTSSQLQS